MGNWQDYFAPNRIMSAEEMRYQKDRLNTKKFQEKTQYDSSTGKTINVLEDITMTPKEEAMLKVQQDQLALDKWYKKAMVGLSGKRLQQATEGYNKYKEFDKGLSALSSAILNPVETPAPKAIPLTFGQLGGRPAVEPTVATLQDRAKVFAANMAIIDSITEPALKVAKVQELAPDLLEVGINPKLVADYVKVKYNRDNALSDLMMLSKQFNLGTPGEE
jgi:hypothetical protein